MLLGAYLLFLNSAEGFAQEVSFAPSCEQYSNGMQISFLDVGQGDATLIRCPDGRTQALIDAGDTNARYPGAESLFLNALLARMATDKKLELAILTHPHPDHSSGFINLLKLIENKQFSIETYIDNNADNPRTKTEELLRAELPKHGTKYRDVYQHNVRNIELCGTTAAQKVQLELWYPDADAANSNFCAIDLNNCSIVTLITYQNLRFLLLADTGFLWESQALRKKHPLLVKPSQVLRTGHHGSESTTAALLEAVQPALTVISSGDPELGTTSKHGYPRRAAVKRLRSYFQKWPKISKLPHGTLKVCRKVAGRYCEWEEFVLSANILSTASMGDIDLFALDNKICISNSLFNIAIVFDFSNEALADNLG